jgi:hypothetical protein
MLWSRSSATPSSHRVTSHAVPACELRPLPGALSSRRAFATMAEPMGQDQQEKGASVNKGVAGYGSFPEPHGFVIIYTIILHVLFFTSMRQERTKRAVDRKRNHSDGPPDCWGGNGGVVSGLKDWTCVIGHLRTPPATSLALPGDPPEHPLDLIGLTRRAVPSAPRRRMPSLFPKNRK